MWAAPTSPAPQPSPTTTSNLALQKNAALLAVRKFADVPAETGAMVAQAFDPVSGLSLRVGMQYGAQDRGMYIFMDMLYRTVVLRAD